MAGKNTAVFGIYRDQPHVERGADALVGDGFRTEDISVLIPGNIGTRDVAQEKYTATAGAGSGAVVGGTLGLLADIGALAIPGVGPFIAAGPLMGALAGAGTGGVVGGIIGALVGLGIPEYQAKRYESMIKDGRVLLSVHCDNSDWVKRANNVLERTGAENIASTGEATPDYAKTDKPKTRSGGGRSDY
jgi:hypothetical protein